MTQDKVQFIAKTKAICVGTVATSPAIDTSGTNFLLASLSFLVTGTPVFSDSNGNAWTLLATADNAGLGQRLAYCPNPVVGAGHTFNFVGLLHSFVVAAFRNVRTSAPLDQQGVGTFQGTGIFGGPLTPVLGGSLLATGLSRASQPGVPTVNSSFVTVDDAAQVTGNNFGCTLAYKVQAAAAQEQPTWAATFDNLSVSMAIFKNILDPEPMNVQVRRKLAAADAVTRKSAKGVYIL